MSRWWITDSTSDRPSAPAGPGYWTRFRPGLRWTPSIFVLRRCEWADAYERLSQNAPLLRYPHQDLPTLAQKAAFSRNRYAMRLEPAQRWDAIGRHWLRGDYHHMAWGWKSLLQDVVIKP